MPDRAQLLALCRVRGASWHFIAREAQRPGGFERLLGGAPSEVGSEAERTMTLLEEASERLAAHAEDVEMLVGVAERDGFRLTTVLDADYPANLRTIYNLPPFLFYRGDLRPEDAFSVAVVGSRDASPDGLARAEGVVTQLVEAGVTILSGLARGIDTAAHRACLAAGGRTIAVLGSGIRRVYPPENTHLAGHIAASGAVVSQFWPDAAPTSHTFPRRNVVTSGMGQGTVVIEASATSGAKMQARLAIEHGKQVFLVRSLVRERSWAQKYLARPGVREVDDVADIISALRTPAQVEQRAEQRVQLALALA